MYYEPSKKTYYRFPSSNSIKEIDSRYYFPDRPYSSGEDIRPEASTEHNEPSDQFPIKK